MNDTRTADERMAAECILTGGTIRTLDPGFPVAQALLWRGNRIVAAGTERELLERCRTRNPTIVDLGGRTAVPGFNDAHIHLTQLGERENGLALGGMNKAEIIEAVRDYAARRPQEELVAGFDWDFPDCPDPHRRDLDAIVPARPVVLLQFSGHGAWLNTAALELLKIRRDTPDWNLGGADRDSDGEPTGVVRELAKAPGARSLYRKYERKRVAADAYLRRALERLREHGITTVQDNTWYPSGVSEFRAAARRGDLTCRVSCWSAGFMPGLDLWFGAKHFETDWFAKGPRKYFADGAFSSHSAWLSEPYADRPQETGRGVPAEGIARWISRALRTGRQLAVHSIGDAATTAYLDAMERFDAGRLVAMRHRIEHGQLIRPGDFERIRQQGMVVSAQPHAAADPSKDKDLLGEERARHAYPFRSLLDVGIALAFGSDYPGERTFDPLYGIHLAVNREGEQAISAHEALAAYTVGGAWAEFRENDKGALRPGYLSDIAVLSDDPIAVDPARIQEIIVDATIVDGKFVYERGGRELRRRAANEPPERNAEPVGRRPTRFTMNDVGD